MYIYLKIYFYEPNAMVLGNWSWLLLLQENLSFDNTVFNLVSP